MKNIKYSILALLVFLTASFSYGQKQKNVILIFIDDIGVEAVGAYGQKEYKTPHLDKLAKGGVRFDNAHASPLCTPSRVKIMTGKYNSRNYKNFGHLPDSEKTFANVMKANGYKTAIAGKWQLSYGQENPLSKPNQFGFDEYCLWNVVTKGLPRFKNPVIHKNGDKLESEGKYGPLVMNDFVNDFITKNKKKPFFIYYPMMLTHDPFQPTPDQADEYASLTDLKLNDAKYFKSNVEYMDKMIGRTVKHLEKLKLRKNTVILIIGDNGTSSHVVSPFQGEDFKGGKGKSTLAGTHVPFIANCPKYIKPSVNKDLIDLTDFFPTITDIAGIEKPANLDGTSFLPQLQGKEGTPRDFIFTSYFGKKSYPVKQYAFNTEWKLYEDGNFYNMKNDPFEKNSISKSTLNPEQLKTYEFLDKTISDLKRTLTSEELAKRNGKGKKKGKGKGKKKGKKKKKGQKEQH